MPGSVSVYIARAHRRGAAARSGLGMTVATGARIHVAPRHARACTDAHLRLGKLAAEVLAEKASLGRAARFSVVLMHGRRASLVTTPRLAGARAQRRGGTRAQSRKHTRPNDGVADTLKRAMAPFRPARGRDGCGAVIRRPGGQCARCIRPPRASALALVPHGRTLNSSLKLSSLSQAISIMISHQAIDMRSPIPVRSRCSGPSPCAGPSRPRSLQ